MMDQKLIKKMIFLIPLNVEIFSIILINKSTTIIANTIKILNKKIKRKWKK